MTPLQVAARTGPGGRLNERRLLSNSGHRTPLTSGGRMSPSLAMENERAGRANAGRCRARCPCHGKRLMWSQNAFTERLNLKWPILQAPMGWLSTPALAAAVSNAGGLGGLGMWGFSAEAAERRDRGIPAVERR